MESKHFQIILYVFFGLLILVGFGTLALYGYLNKDAAQNQGQADVDVQIWGTIADREMQPIVKQLESIPDATYRAVTYTQKNPVTVRDEYIEAIAVGKQPDVLFLDHTTLLNLEETLQTVPFSYYPLAQYQQSFIPAANIFIRDDGYLAFPFFSDALVLYYNENLRLREYIQVLPSLWEHFTTSGYQDVSGRYREEGKALIPIGAYDNYANASAFFTALMLQVRESPGGMTLESVEQMLRFYRSFANPRQSVYTWNTALPDARDLFVGDRLLFYPGYVSEFSELRRANPNVVVRIAPLPQISRDSTAVTSARLYAFAIPKSSAVSTAALQAIFHLLGIFSDPENDLSALFSLPPAIQNYFPDDNASITETIIIESLFPTRAVHLDPSAEAVLLQTLRNVVVGVTTTKDAANVILPLFE